METTTPRVPADVSLREMERLLDRLAVEMLAMGRDGVLIVGSGNVVHNLRRLDPSLPDDGFDWAHRFDEAARSIMTEDPGAVARLQEHPDLTAAVPTAEHFLPLVYLAGLADAAGTPAEVLVGGYQLGSLSMTSYTVGL